MTGEATAGAGGVAVALAALRDRIHRAGGTNVEIVAVTKGFGVDAIEAAVAAGCSRIGENYAQELLAKREVIERLAVELHFIGQLQSNKIRQLAQLVDWWETVDRPSVVDQLASRAPRATVLIQVDTSGEPGKGGVAPEGVAALIERCRAGGLDVRGLMTVGPTRGGPEAARPGFRRVRSMADDLGLAEVSMGMTDDLEVAVQEGSTQVRVGTALFGRRHRP